MEFKKYVNQISNPDLRSACWRIEDSKDFFKWPASTYFHHAYVGGLWIHTAEVLDFALKDSEAFPQVNKDVLIAAALWHDYAKIWDYKLSTYFNDQYNELPKRYVLVEDHISYKKVYIEDIEYKKKIHHITGSVAEFTCHAFPRGVDRKIIQEIQHCIIAHHGFLKEWGSIREPQSLEAILLHHADYKSAHFGPRKNK